MRTLLQRGKLIPPTALVDAFKRRRELDFEIRKCTTHINDPNRAFRYKTPAEYEEWRGRAQRACSHFWEERRQLADWIEEQLLVAIRDGRDLFNTLVEEDVEFEDNELKVVEKYAAICEVRR